MINRGNYRRNLFADRGTAAAFERVLDEAAVRFGWKIHAYVVMRTHFHLALELTEPNLSLGMKWLQGTWVRRYNNRRRLVGRPFQGRYKALHVEPGTSQARVCHYIHLNPVRAGVVPIERMDRYTFSSLRRFTLKPRPAWLVADRLLAESGGLPDTPKGWRLYCAHVKIVCGREDASGWLASRSLTRGWYIGTQHFRRELVRQAASAGIQVGAARIPGLDRGEMKAERERGWGERLYVLAQRAGIDLEKLPFKKSCAEKMLLAAVMRRTTSASNAWLAEALDIGAPKALSVAIARWRNHSGAEADIAVLCKRLNAET